MYSIPKILFGEDKIFAYLLISFKYISTAFSRALGNDTPFDNSCFKIDVYSGGSFIKTLLIFSRVFKSPHSLPKERVISPLRLSKIFIAPLEKFSALEML